MNTKITRRKLIGAGAAASAAALLWTDRPCTYHLRVEEHTLKLPRWSAAPMKVTLLSDLHVHSIEGADFARKAVQAAVDSHPEAILLTGDFITAHSPVSLPLLTEALSPLEHADCISLAVLGNHDGAVRQDKLRHTLRNSGVILLQDSAAQVGDVTFLGFRDALVERPNFRRFQSIVGPPNTVVLLHEPDYVAQAPKWASLQLSGHSHGGQVCLPFGIALHCPEGGERYINGFYPNAPIPTYVSRGIGTRGVNLRINCPPEVSILTLTRLNGNINSPAILPA